MPPRSALPGTLPLIVLLALGSAAMCAHAQGAALQWNGTGDLVCAPGGQVQAHLSLDYSGTGAVEVWIGLETEPAGWSHNISAWVGGERRSSTGFLDIPLPDGEPLAVRVDVETSPSAQAGPYPMAVKAYVTSDPSASDVHVFNVTIVYVPDLLIELLSPLPGNATVDPGTAAPVELRLTNRGNSYDRFLMSAWTSGEGARWGVSRDRGLDAQGWTPVIDEGGDHALSFMAEVPPSAPPGEEAFVMVFATCERAPEYTPPSVTAAFRVRFIADIEVSLLGPSTVPVTFAGGEDSLVNITFVVRNEGNARDDVSVDPSADDIVLAGGTVRALPPSVSLPQGATQTPVVSVTVPSSLAAGDYWVNVTFNSSVPNLTARRGVLLAVAAHRWVGATCPSPRMVAGPGDVVEFVLAVRNGGNVVDSYTTLLEGVPTGWPTYVMPTELSLLPDETGELRLRVIVPTGFAEAPPPTSILTLTVDVTKGGAFASCDLFLVLERFHRIEWALGGEPITGEGAPVATAGAAGPPIVLNPFAEHHGWTAPRLTVMNLGTVEANVSLSVGSTEPLIMVTVTPLAVRIPWGEGAAVAITVDVPRSVPPGEHWVNVTVRCDDDASQTPRVVPLLVTVVTVDAAVGPRLALNGSSVVRLENGTYEALAGAMVTVRFDVTNNGSSSLEALTVRVSHQGPDGRWELLDSFTMALGAGMSASRELVWSVGQGAGAHRLEAVAYLANQSDQGNDLAFAELVVPTAIPPEGHAAGLPLWVVAVAVGALVAVSVQLLRIRGGPGGGRGRGRAE